MGRIPHEAFIPEETEGLQGLEKVNRDLIRKATLGKSPWLATIDIHATFIESDKREALYTYLGYRGYQPVIAYWVEPDLIVADQFRDGNVPAGIRLKEVLQKALRALPSTVRWVRFRSDSAAYVHELLDWCREEIPGRPRIEFAKMRDRGKSH